LAVAYIHASFCDFVPQGLVLDLDHTLLNSATYDELDDEARAALDAWCSKERGACGATCGDGNPGSNDATCGGEQAQGDASAELGGRAEREPLLYHLHHIGMWTKLRPCAAAHLILAPTLDWL
jgi:hypothetical protein